MPRRDLNWPQPLLDRISELAQMRGISEPDIMREAMESGVASLEKKEAETIAFQNARGVQRRLKRKNEHWEEAIDRLKNGTADMQEIWQLLDGAAN